MTQLHPLPGDVAPLSTPDPPLPIPETPSDPPPFVWLMDLTGSIIDHSLQASWGVTALAAVASFLHDPLHRNMESLLPWATAHGSPARFMLHHADSTPPPLTSAATPLGLLAADYGLKARSASGIRGDDLEDWPNLVDPDDRELVLSHYPRILMLSTLSPAATAMVTAGINPSALAQASSEGPSPLFSYHHGVNPTSLIDHILLSSSCQGQIAFAGVGCGAFFSSISDHRPVLLGLHLHNASPSMRLGRQAPNPPPRTLDLDLSQPSTEDPRSGPLPTGAGRRLRCPHDCPPVIPPCLHFPG